MCTAVAPPPGNLELEGREEPRCIVVVYQDGLHQPQVVLRVGESEGRLVDHQEILIAPAAVVEQDLALDVHNLDGHAPTAVLGVLEVVLDADRRVGKANPGAVALAGIGEEPDPEILGDILAYFEKSPDAAVGLGMNAAQNPRRGRITHVQKLPREIGDFIDLAGLFRRTRVILEGIVRCV